MQADYVLFDVGHAEPGADGIVWQRRFPPAVLTSIVIPSFNHATYLGDCVRSALAQRSADIEVIVVDDGSTDATAALCAGFPDVRYHYQANRGLPAARNAGWRLARGTFVVCLDADDRLRPEAVAVGTSRLRLRPGCAFTAGDHCYIDAGGNLVGSWSRELPKARHYEALLAGNYVGMGGAVLYRRAALAAHGGFDESLRACEDYDLYLRIARQSPIDSHDHVVAEYRRHDANMSADAVLMLESALGVLVAQRAATADDRERSNALADGLNYWVSYYGPAVARRCHGPGGHVHWHRLLRMAAAVRPIAPAVSTTVLGWLAPALRAPA